MAAEQGIIPKLCYDITVKAIIFNYTDAANKTETDITSVFDLDYNNILEFNIDSNPRKKSVTIYNLKLKNILKVYQESYINSNIVFYIKTVEKLPHNGITYSSLVLENYFKVINYQYIENSTTMEIEYDLVTMNAAGLLFSQRYNTNMSQNDALLTYNTASEILKNVIDTAAKYFKSNLKMLLNEYGSDTLLAGLPLTRDILFRTLFYESGLNLTTYSNTRLPVRNDLNDITIVKYILDYYKLYLTPTYFIFDDSRCVPNIESVNFFEAIDQNSEILARTMRMYTYVFINTFNPASLPKSSCWLPPESFDPFLINNDNNTRFNNNSETDVILDDGTSVSVNNYYTPQPSTISEWRLNSNMRKTESLINKEDLRTKARSKIFLIHPYGGALNATIVPEKSSVLEDGPVNTIRIETEMDPKLFCASMKCEDYLFRNDAGIYKANFKLMRYNTLDYNVAYDIIRKNEYNYVLLSSFKKFTFDGEAKAYSLETDAEFIYLPGVVNVDIRTGDSINSNGLASTVSNIIGKTTSMISGSTSFNIQDVLKSVEYQNLSPTEKIQKLKELSQQIADKYKIQTESYGKATYYNAKSADSKYTANGEIFDDKAMTAAHNSLPFNTMVLVENLDTGKSVIVRINDTGGFQSGKYKNSGRIIDLTEGAANVIGSVYAGIANVKLTVVGYNGVVGDMNAPTKKR